MSDAEDQAHEAWEEGNLRKARELFALAIAQGKKCALLNLGYFYDEGLGIPRSKSTALRLYKLAYQNGDSSGATNIAIVCKERNQVKAMFSWFRRASVGGDGDAELDLAKCYLNGVGAVRSRARALKHLRRAINSINVTPASQEEAYALHSRLTRRSSGPTAACRYRPVISFSAFRVSLRRAA